MTDRSIPIPEGLDLITDYQGVVIRRKWFSHVVWFILLFVIVWDSFLITWYSSVTRIDGKDLFSLLFYIFPLGHVAVGVGLTYFCVCVFFNTTDILARPDHLQIITYPLPWIGSKVVSRRDLNGFLVRERWSNNNNYNNGARSVTYKVSYVDTDNREQTLLARLSNREQAEYISAYLAQYYQLLHN